MIVGIGVIVVGVLVLAVSRTVVAAFELPGNDAATTRFLGFGDDLPSRFRRWVAVVVIGLGCVGIGVARVFS